MKVTRYQFAFHSVYDLSRIYFHEAIVKRETPCKRKINETQVRNETFPRETAIKTKNRMYAISEGNWLWSISRFHRRRWSDAALFHLRLVWSEKKRRFGEHVDADVRRCSVDHNRKAIDALNPV